MALIHPRRRRGATALEFILALPFLLVVVLGVADLSAYLSTLYEVQRSARDGARVGSITLEGLEPDGEKIKAAAIAQAKVVLASVGKDCDVGCTVSAEWILDNQFRYVDVYVQVPHQPITPGMGIIPNSASARFVMLTQQQL